MDKFTASEVRDAITWKYGDKLTRISAMLTAFADMLEEREKAVPIGWVFQHEETGRMTFCENDGVNNAENFAANNPRHVLCGPAFTHPAPADAERLAEALRDARDTVLAFLGDVAADGSRCGMKQAVIKSMFASLLDRFAAHSAQAQPPAARVPPRAVYDHAHKCWFAGNKELSTAEATGWNICRADMLAAQENPNG